jgi:hypothetical protein
MKEEHEICPRCGSAVSWFERYRVKTGSGYRYYLYAVHYDPDSKRRRKCYLGPVSGYEYAVKTNPFIPLTGFRPDTDEEWDRRVDYVVSILESFIDCRSVDAIKRLINNLKAIVPRLEKRLESLKEELKEGVVSR